MALATLAVVVPFLIGDVAAVAAPPTGLPCKTSGDGVTLHYRLADPQSAHLQIGGAVIEGFDARGCAGDPVRVTFFGNPSGDAGVAPTRPLATWDSRLDPCTGAELTSATTIANGAIEIDGCKKTTSANGGPFVRVHDVTGVAVEVRGTRINPGATPIVLGVQESAGRPPVTRENSGDGLLPGVGGPSSTLMLLGTVLFAAGIGALVRARANEAVPSGMSDQ